MDWRKIFLGIPDGQGLGEDPSSLASLYSSFESKCFNRTDPRTVDVTSVWFPIGNQLRNMSFKQLSRWMMTQTLLETYRFGESALATAQVMSDGNFDRVTNAFEEVPPHLQSWLFGHQIDDSRVSELKIIFRKTFRLAWLRANNDEVVYANRVSEDEFEALTDTVQLYSMKVGAENIDFVELAKVTDYQVRTALLQGREKRMPTLAASQYALSTRRYHLTALIKAVTDPANRK